MAKFRGKKFAVSQRRKMRREGREEAGGRPLKNFTEEELDARRRRISADRIREHEEEVLAGDEFHGD